MHLWPEKKEEAGLVRGSSMGYRAVHLGMMGEEGRTEAAPDEPHRRGAAALLSCTESLHGHQDECYARLCHSSGMLQAGALHASLYMGAAKWMMPAINRTHELQMAMPAGQRQPPE